MCALANPENCEALEELKAIVEKGFKELNKKFDAHEASLALYKRIFRWSERAGIAIGFLTIGILVGLGILSLNTAVAFLH